MTVRIQCRCGTVQAVIEPAGLLGRATCYCRDCQAWAHWLGTPGLLDARGGTDILAAMPARMHITAGMEQLACATLSGRVLRWYAACCRSPLGATARSAKAQYVGIPVSTAVSPAEVEAHVGAEGRAVAHAGSATAHVRSTPLGIARVGARVGLALVGARLRGERRSPFFDPASGRPVRVPERITAPHPEMQP